MALVVQKFGGTSVADPDRLRSAARRLVAAREEGHEVVGVLSAMGGATDELLALAHTISETPDPRELDMLLSVGERISCALAAMAIHDLGHEAISLTGSQAGIVTDTAHTSAKIVEIRAPRIRTALDGGAIVLVAGFQGVSTTLEVTTLGRGGSDTTAVALAAALGADRCEIFTDVEGVFTADPRIVPDARKLDAISYEEMLELAAAGREGDDAPVGRVRAQARSPHSRPFIPLGGRGHLDRQSGGAHGGTDHLGHRARHLGGGDHDSGRARTGLGSPPASSARSPTSASTST